jgi:hypothetical protein
MFVFIYEDSDWDLKVASSSTLIPQRELVKAARTGHATVSDRRYRKPALRLGGPSTMKLYSYFLLS